MKNILFIGNSFTFFSELPEMTSALANKAGDEVHIESVTFGGAYLHEFADPAHNYHKKLAEVYPNNKWDYIILQDQSRNPAENTEDCVNAVKSLYEMMKDCGAKFLMYSTWAYKDGSTTLESTGMTYTEMLTKLTDGYKKAAEAIGAACVHVGQAFARSTAEHPEIDLYDRNDFYHPHITGTYLASCLFYQAITGKPATNLDGIEKIDSETAEKLRTTAVEFD